MFEGQSEAAIREHEAGLTLIRDTFRDVPKAIDIDERYPDQLWVKDSRFENISGPVVTISLEKSPLTEIGFENAILRNAPVFAKLRESGKTVAGKGAVYEVKNFTYGLIVPGEGRMGSIGMQYEAAPLALVTGGASGRDSGASAQQRMGECACARSEGRRKQLMTLRHCSKAINTHRVLYLPGGHYVVRDTITLKPDTVLIGLHPTLTQIDLLDETPGYQGVGAPKAVLLAPPGGENIVSGIGVFAGGINPRAVAVLWKAGEQSLMDDVRFLGGHGSGGNPYNNNHTADS